jgi:hypothetical protein
METTIAHMLIGKCFLHQISRMALTVCLAYAILNPITWNEIGIVSPWRSEQLWLLILTTIKLQLRNSLALAPSCRAFTLAPETVPSETDSANEGRILSDGFMAYPALFPRSTCSTARC